MKNIINGFKLENAAKLERAETVVGSDATTLLAEYDRLGGLITKNGDKVKTGSFYDFEAKKPRAKPKVVFVYTVDGEFVDVPEGEELPGEVRAARTLANARARKAKKGGAKSGKKDDESGEDESEEDSEDVDE